MTAGLDEATIDAHLGDGWIRLNGDPVTDLNVDGTGRIVLVPPKA